MKVFEWKGGAPVVVGDYFTYLPIMARSGACSGSGPDCNVGSSAIAAWVYCTLGGRVRLYEIRGGILCTLSCASPPEACFGD
jgi:hypothetical protein